MKRKNFFSVSLIMIITIAFVLPNAAFSSDKKVLKYTINHPPEHLDGFQAKMISDIVKEKTNGEIVLQVFYSSALGGIDEQIAMVKTGTTDLCGQFASTFGGLYSDLGALNLPYLYRDLNHAKKGTSPISPLVKKMNETLTRVAGIRLVGNTYSGSRMLTCDSPIYKPEDLKTKKIRAIPQPTFIALVEGMGAIATPVDFKELPAALAAGIVNGQENPPQTIYAFKLYEMQKYLMLTRHNLDYGSIAANEKTWQSLTENQRKIIIEAAMEAADRATEKGIKSEIEILDKLKKGGMKIIGPEDGLDVKAFRERVMNHCRNKFPQWVNYMQEIQDIK